MFHILHARVYDKEKYKNFAITGVIVSCISVLVNTICVWSLIGMDIFSLLKTGVFFVRVIETTNTVAWILAGVSLILSYPSINDIMNIFKKISITLMPILGALIIIQTWSNGTADFFVRLQAISGVLTVGSFICTILLTRIFKDEIKKINGKETSIQPNPRPINPGPNNVVQQPDMNSPQPTNPMDNMQQNPFNNNDNNM